MTTLATTLMTAEEFAELPDPADGSRLELVRGEVVTMPPPSGYHGQCCAEIGFHLRTYGGTGPTRRGHVTSNDSGVRLESDPDTVRGPDVAYWDKERLPQMPRTGYPAVAPDLVVEVMSPSDVFTKVMAKVQQYLDAGVRLVWVAVPEDQAVAVYSPGGRPVRLLTAADTISGEDVLPGFTCPVAGFFP
ncbi:MAG: Uma2 family endonuclease [Gemmataceae bacterium]